MSTGNGRLATQHHIAYHYVDCIHHSNVPLHKLFGEYCRSATVAIDTNQNSTEFVRITFGYWCRWHRFQSILFHGRPITIVFSFWTWIYFLRFCNRSMQPNRLARRFMSKRCWRKMDRTISCHWKMVFNAYDRYYVMKRLSYRSIEFNCINLKGLFAFHMELALGYKLMSETFFEDEKCGIREIAYLQVTDPWYAIRKNSSFKEMFKIGQVFSHRQNWTELRTWQIRIFRMFRMHEHGLQERVNARMYTKKPKCTGSGGNFITASLVDTKPALLILLWGYLLGICTLLIELIVHRVKMGKGNS